MDAAAVLERLKTLGVTVVPRPNGNLWLEPASVIPPDLVEMVREYKPEIMAVLQAEASLPAGALGLLERLRRGMEWLTETHEHLLKTGEQYRAMEERFLAGLDLWDKLEYMLRFTYPDYKGCVLGPGQRCPEESPVTCWACARLLEA